MVALPVGVVVGVVVGVGVAVAVAVVVDAGVDVGVTVSVTVGVGVALTVVGVGAGTGDVDWPRFGRTTLPIVVPPESSPVKSVETGRPVASSNAVTAPMTRANTTRLTTAIRRQW